MLTLHCSTVLHYVALWDPESTKLQCYLGPSLRDWRTLIHFNVVLTVFHIGHISQVVCKTVRTKFWCIIVLQLWREGPEKAPNYGTDWGQIFRTFSPQLVNNDTLKLHTQWDMWSMWKTVRMSQWVNEILSHLVIKSLIHWVNESMSNWITESQSHLGKV